MERINAHKRVKREDKKNNETKGDEGAKPEGDKTKGTTTASASDLIVYFPIYIVSLLVLLQD